MLTQAIELDKCSMILEIFVVHWYYYGNVSDIAKLVEHSVPCHTRYM